jgi:hypothetical protein
MEDYDADAAFARRFIDFDADDPATQKKCGLRIAEWRK